MKITTNKFITASYDLHVGGEDEKPELMESTSPENPLQFIYGTGTMLPAFEQELMGLEEGNSFKFTIKPENAYGEYTTDNVVELEKSVFMVNGKFDKDTIKEGNTIPMMDSNGNRMNGSVLEVKDDVIIMDFNHPLAGETLHFTGTILEVREATVEELTALTKSCGCGCGDGCGDSGCGDSGCGDGCGDDDDCGGHKKGGCGGGCH